MLEYLRNAIMTGLIRRQMGIMFLVIVAVTLLTLPAYVSAQSNSPCKGSWSGTVGPGTGTIFYRGVTTEITTNSIVTGTFDGDTTHGNLMGTVITNYTEPGITNGEVSSATTGNYVMSVAGNGTVTGSATIPLTGQLVGQMRITFLGKESQSGELTGTWTGTLTVTKIISQSTSYGASITAPGSGQFTGSV